LQAEGNMTLRSGGAAAAQHQAARGERATPDSGRTPATSQSTTQAPRAHPEMPPHPRLHPLFLLLILLVGCQDRLLLLLIQLRSTVPLNHSCLLLRRGRAPRAGPCARPVLHDAI
jgi:hypothetical protein